MQNPPRSKPASGSLLGVFLHERFYDVVRAAAPDGTECLLAGSPDQALSIVTDAAPDLVIIEMGIEGGAEGLCRRLRSTGQGGSLQMLVIADSAGPAEIALLAGFDAALLSASRTEEFRLAIRAAFLRRLRTAALIREREFFRAAVRREESLSSHLLDEHLALKDAFRSLTKG
jgi:DNA-binding response OmpR family regulator